MIGFAGDKMVLEEHEDGSATVHFDDKGTGRSCGSCTLCCRLLPIEPVLHKPAGQKCTHQRWAKGCAIYVKRPTPCRSWSCRWLADPTSTKLRRPDRGHYVVDMTWDHIELDAGEGRVEIPALQVWLDPAHRDAHRAPELRDYIAMMGEKYRAVAVIRYSSSETLILVPPTACAENAWLELEGTPDPFRTAPRPPSAMTLTFTE